MKDEDLWTTFEKTGRISDYLQYKNVYGEEFEDYFTSDKDQVGEEKFESDSNPNRHDTVRSTYRGI